MQVWNLIESEQFLRLVLDGHPQFLEIGLGLDQELFEEGVWYEAWL